MGILNVTPDSFSDGGLFYSQQKAVERGLQMADEGADIIDIGGESTRPGAASVSAAIELKRVLPVIESLVKQVKIPISIDTKKAQVARQAAASADVRRGDQARNVQRRNWANRGERASQRCAGHLVRDHGIESCRQTQDGRAVCKPNYVRS